MVSEDDKLPASQVDTAVIAIDLITDRRVTVYLSLLQNEFNM